MPTGNNLSKQSSFFSDPLFGLGGSGSSGGYPDEPQDPVLPPIIPGSRDVEKPPELQESSGGFFSELGNEVGGFFSGLTGLSGAEATGQEPIDISGGKELGKQARGLLSDFAREELKARIDSEIGDSDAQGQKTVENKRPELMDELQPYVDAFTNTVSESAQSSPFFTAGGLTITNRQALIGAVGSLIAVAVWS